jgi:predicted dehydrogenase
MATSPASTISVGIIGASRVAPAHAVAIRDLAPTDLVAVADPDVARAERLAEPYGATVVPDYRSLLDRSDVDLVMLSVPNHLHAPVAIDALDAGKHVFVEKPMANTLEECDAMIAAASRAGRELFIGHSQRFYASTVEARRLCLGGELGAPIMARDVWTKALGAETRPPWFLDRSRGGGMWLMNGAHMIDRCCWVLNSGVVSVLGWVGNPIHGLAADDASTAQLVLRNGAHVSIFHAGYRDHGTEHCGAEIVLTDGMLEFDSYTNRVQVARAGTYERRDPPKVDAFTRELAAMVETITRGVPAAVPTAWARHIVAVMLAVEESGRTGRLVAIGEADYAEPAA